MYIKQFTGALARSGNFLCQGFCFSISKHFLARSIPLRLFLW